MASTTLESKPSNFKLTHYLGFGEGLIGVAERLPQKLQDAHVGPGRLDTSRGAGLP